MPRSAPASSSSSARPSRTPGPRSSSPSSSPGITALFSALSYAELAGSIPVSGSSYSYAYATLGELIAWVCGWCLILEYGVSVAAVAVGWGQYLNELLDGTFGVTIPDALSQPPGDGGIFNLPALVVVLLAMVFLLGGAKESARANTIMVAVKIVALLLFCGVALQGVQLRQLRELHADGHGGRQRRRRHPVLLVHRLRRRLHRR